MSTGERTPMALDEEPRSVPDPETVTPILQPTQEEAFGEEQKPPAPPQASLPPTQSPTLAWVTAESLDADFEVSRKRYSGNEKPVPVPWLALAEQLGGGLWPGLHVLVGGSGVGKSTLALQITLDAALRLLPSVYVGLELEARQVRLRLLALLAKVPWSTVYLGRAPNDPEQEIATRDLNTALSFIDQLAALPIAVSEASPQGWPASNLRVIAKGLRDKFPEGPALIVLDFLQLVGAEPDNQRADLRERIGAAAYQARCVAKDHGIAVLVVSSTARDRYPLLGVDRDGKHEAGIEVRETDDRLVGRLLNRDALIGMGKESGECEYAADSITVMLRWRSELQGEHSRRTGVILASPKVRTGGEGWCELLFDGHTFEEATDQPIARALFRGPRSSSKTTNPKTPQRKPIESG